MWIRLMHKKHVNELWIRKVVCHNRTFSLHHAGAKHRPENLTRLIPVISNWFHTHGSVRKKAICPSTCPTTLSTPVQKGQSFSPSPRTITPSLGHLPSYKRDPTSAVSQCPVEPITLAFPRKLTLAVSQFSAWSLYLVLSRPVSEWWIRLSSSSRNS